MSLPAKKRPRVVRADSAGDEVSPAVKLAPVNAAGRRSRPRVKQKGDAQAGAEIRLPDSWTEIIEDPELWAELRELLLGSE